MAAFGYNVKELIESIKARCLVPISQITFSNEDLIRFANEEIEMKMVPSIIKVKEEYYVIKQKFSISEYKGIFEIPYRAVGSKLRNVSYENQALSYPLSRIQPEQIPYYEYGATADTTKAFYVEGNFIKLAARFGTGSGYVILSYYFAPNKLVDESRVGVISAIDRVGDGAIGSVTISNMSFPDNFTANSLVDFLQVRPNYRTYDYDKVIQNVNPSTNQVFIKLTDIPADLVVGDHIASAGECIIPQIPRELHPMLAQAVACRILEAMGDTDNLKIAYTKLADMDSNLFALIDQRTEGNPQKVNNLNSPINQSRLGYRRWGGGYRS